MESDRPKNDGGKGGVIACVIAATLILYALAPGPLRYIMMGRHPAREAVLIAFKPLEFLYEHVGLVKNFYDWYFDFF